MKQMYTLQFIVILLISTSLCIAENDASTRGLSAEELAWMKSKTSSGGASKKGTRAKKAVPTHTVSTGEDKAATIEHLLRGVVALEGAAKSAVDAAERATSDQDINQRQVYVPEKSSEHSAALSTGADDGDVLEMKLKQFDEMLENVKRDGIILFVEFYALWCNHCRHLSPIWRRLAGFYRSDPRIVFAKINGDGNDKLMSRYDVQGYPNMLLFTKANPSGELYKGKRTFEVMLKWLQDRIGSPVIAANSKHPEYHRALNDYNRRQHPDRVVDLKAEEQKREALAAAKNAQPHKATTETKVSTEAKKPDVKEARKVDAETAPSGPFDSSDDGMFNGAEGVQLYYQSWELEDQSEEEKHVVILLHGLGEHSGSYSAIADALYANGITIYAYDMRGHGRSPGIRGHVSKWSLLRDDLTAMIRFASERESVRRVSLIGHDMGALLGLDYTLFNPLVLRGVVAFSPRLLDSSSATSAAQSLLTNVLSYVWSSYTVDTGVQVEDESRDITVGRRLHADSLHHSKISIRLRNEMHEIADTVVRFASSIRTPLLIVQGGGDEITPAAGAKVLIDAFGEKNSLAQLIVVNDVLHRVFDDPSMGTDTMIAVHNWLIGVAQ